MDSPGVSGEKISEILESIGLNKNEIRIYLDLVKSPPSSALEISKRTNIHRSNTYDSLRKLCEKGFAKEIIQDTKKLFQAIEPEKIKDYIKQKQQEFELILPQLKNFAIAPDNSNAVSISQGAFSAREALTDLLDLNDTILAYGASNAAVETFGQGFLKEFHAKRIKQKIVMKHIYNKSALDRIRLLNKMKFTEARYLSEKYSTIAATVVCADTVVFFIFGKPTITITLKNSEIAKAYRGYFDVLWKQSKI